MILEGAQAHGRLAEYFEAIGERGATIADLRPLAYGWETHVFAFTKTQEAQVQELVLRVYAGENTAGRAAVEFRIMQGLRAAGYPVPQVFRLEGDAGWFGGPAILMELVRGRLMRERYDSADPAARRTLTGLFCQLLVRLHGLDGHAVLGPDAPAANTFDPGWLAATLREVGLAEPFAPFVDWLMQFGQAIRPEPCIIHGDYHSDNILLAEDGSPAVIDWSCAGIADRRCDLAQTVILLTAQYGDPESAQAVRRGYEALIGRELSHFAYFEALVVARRLMIMAVALVAGAAKLGLRPGMEEQLRANTGHTLQLCALLRERTGLPTTAIENIFSQFE